MTMSSRKDGPNTWGWGAGAWGWGSIDDKSAGELIEGLSAEFAPLVDAETVTELVQQSRRDLDAKPSPTPQAVERLVRQRLSDMTGAYQIAGVADTGWAAGSSAYLVMQFLSDLGDWSARLPTSETRTADDATDPKRPRKPRRKRMSRTAPPQEEPRRPAHQPGRQAHRFT